MSAVEGPTSREELVYERLRSGAFQLEATADSIEAAFDAAVALRNRAPKKTDLHSALLDLADYLDSAGAAVSEIAAAPDSADTVSKDLPAYESQLKEVLQVATNAERDLEEAQDIASSLLEAATGEAHETFQSLFDQVNQALEDVKGAVAALKGED